MTVVYSEAMNALVIPTVTFTPAVASSLSLNAASGWTNNNTTYVARYTVADANVAVPNVGIGVTGAQIANGNVQVPYSGTNNFNVDTQNPTVTSYSLSPDTGISGDQITSNTTPTLTYTFSEPISGSAGDVAVSGATHGAVTPDTITWGSNTLTLSFTTPLVDDVYTVTLNGSTPGYIADAAGNALHGNQSGGNDAGNDVRTFTIDTAAPVVSSVTPNLTLVADANVGTATFSVTVVYNEPMNQTMAPTLTFTPAVASTLTLNAGSGWSNSTTYVAKYDVADANVTVPNVGIGVTLGQDAAGNVQTAYSGTDNFNIDTQNPTVASVTPNLTLVLKSAVGTKTFTLTIVYSEPMKATVNPTIVFPSPGEDPTSDGTLTANGGSWTNSTTFVASYDVANKNLVMPSIDVQVSGRKTRRAMPRRLPRHPTFSAFPCRRSPASLASSTWTPTTTAIGSFLPASITWGSAGSP